MSKNIDNKEKKTEDSNLDVQIAKIKENRAVLIAVIGLISAVAGYYFNYLTTRTQIELPLFATETASVKIATATASPATTTVHSTASSSLVSTQTFTLSSEAQASNSVTIAHFPAEVYAYVVPSAPYSDKFFSQLSIVNNGNLDIDYEWDYHLPEETETPRSAGLGFKFVEIQDFTSYDFVEITITFGNKNTRCSFGLTDVTGKAAWISIGKDSEYKNVTATVTENTHTVIIPLKDNFNELNLKVIDAILFDDGTHRSTGRHTVTVNSVKFVRDEM